MWSMQIIRQTQPAICVRINNLDAFKDLFVKFCVVNPAGEGLR